VPLDGEDEVAGGGELDGFDDVVLGRAGGDEEVIAGGADGLVMAGVYLGGEGWGWRSGSFTAFRMTAAFLIGIFLYAKFRPGAPLFLREGPALTRCPALWSTWHRRHA
jgi:hypothetical protein